MAAKLQPTRDVIAIGGGLQCPSLIGNRKALLDPKNVAGWPGFLKQQP